MSARSGRNVRGIEIALTIGGAGEPLLYLHSASGEASTWNDFFAGLADRFEVFVPAHPGFPGSGGLDRIDRVEDVALHYVDLLQDLELAKVHLVGSSLGGWIAAELASLWPERVQSLVLVDAAGLWLDEAPPREIFGLKPDVLAQRLFHDQGHPFAQMLQIAATAKPEEQPEEFLVGFFQSTEATARLAWDPYMHNPKLARRLERCTAPTLVLWGDHDELIPIAHGRRYCELLTRVPGGATLKTIADCGHLPVLEQPEALIREIVTFAGEHPIPVR
jgi:pimeloyl-ACP methyl ester carboxylesterase